MSKKHPHLPRTACFLLFAAPWLFSACSKPDYLSDCIPDSSLRREQQELTRLLRSPDTGREALFTVKNRIARNLAATDNLPALTAFLTSDAVRGADPYAAYWLLVAADVYMEQNSPQIAAYYFERILDNCKDLTVRGNSIHQICLQNLIRITDSPFHLVRYYTDYIRQFPQDEKIPEFYFLLGRAHEKAGEWEKAIQSYTRFLQLGQYDILVPDIPNAYAYAKRITDYNNSAKDWTFATLDELVTSVKRAIDRYDARALERYRAKVNFFSMSWKQDYTDTEDTQVEFQMRDFMHGNRITYADELDPTSTPYEAYLRTSGWNQYVTVWYLYFRKVNFPADPNIHGRWEWAGIYYGEKI